jgi:phage I-like protein
LGNNNGGPSQLAGMRVTARPATAGVDEVSMLHDTSSIQENWESRINTLVEERMKQLQESWRSQNTDGISIVSAGKNDDILKENLRRFVAERVFSKFKFIFKQERLGQVVELALTNNFITKPDEWELADMQKHYSQVVRSCLDGCRANAQSVARKNT